MKKITLISIFVVIALMIFSSAEVSACNIKFKVIKNKKEVYKAGDIIVVKVIVYYTHRNCLIEIDDTKFDTKGLKIVKMSDWFEICSGVWENELTLKVKGTKNGKLIINATRTCSRSGGFGSLSLKSKPIKK